MSVWLWIVYGYAGLLVLLVAYHLVRQRRTEAAFMAEVERWAKGLSDD